MSVRGADSHSEPTIPVVLVRWEDFLVWLFERTAGFPRRIRASITTRIEQRALDVYEGLEQARWEPARRARLLAEVDQGIGLLRILVRLAHRHHALSSGAYEHAAAELDTVGRMVGGWRRGSP